MAARPQSPAGLRREDDNKTILTPEFMQKLDALEILSRKIFTGSIKGERRTRRQGESVEFADYRNYVVGDDLRFIDWNIYGRLERLLLKLFLEEQDLNVTVLFDMSKSMDWGKPNKGLYAKRVAAAIAYIGLVRMDRVSLYGFNSSLVHEMSGVRGRRFTSQVIKFLDEIELEGESHFANAARRFSLRHRGKGVVVVISDFFDKGGYADGIRYLLSRDLDLYAIQVLSPEEITPTLTGDLKLKDVEDGDLAEVSITAPLMTRYKANLEAYCSELKDHCVRRGITYLFTGTTVPFDVLVLSYLRQRGLVR
jgi:uncharacterized protein (DUF58 family)